MSRTNTPAARSVDDAFSGDDREAMIHQGMSGVAPDASFLKDLSRLQRDQIVSSLVDNVFSSDHQNAVLKEAAVIQPSTIAHTLHIEHAEMRLALSGTPVDMNADGGEGGNLMEALQSIAASQADVVMMDGTEEQDLLQDSDVLPAQPQRLDFSSFPDGTLDDYGVVTHPHAGRIKIWTGSEHQPVITGGKLRAHIDGSDHLSMSFLDAPVYLSSVDVRRLSGTDGNLLVAINTPENPDGAPHYITIPAGAASAAISMHVTTIQIIHRADGSRMELDGFQLEDPDSLPETLDADGIDAALSSITPTPLQEEIRVEDTVERLPIAGSSHAFSSLPDGEIRNESIISHPTFGQMKIWTGSGASPVLKEGTLRAKEDGSDHLIFSFLDEPVFLSSFVFERLGGAEERILITIEEPDGTLSQLVLGAHATTLNVNLLAKTVSIVNVTGKTPFALVTIVQEERSDITARSSFTNPLNGDGFDIPMALASYNPETVLRILDERLPMQSGLPDFLPRVTQFSGDVNDTLNMFVDDEILRLLLEIDPSLSPPSKDLIALRYDLRVAGDPHFRSIRSLENYRDDAWHRWQTDFRNSALAAVQYVLAANKRDLNTMTDTRDTIGFPSGLQELGFASPSPDSIRSAATVAVFQYFDQINAALEQQRAAVAQEIVHQQSPTYAGSGESKTSDNPPPPDPDLARRMNRLDGKIAAAQGNDAQTTGTIAKGNGTTVIANSSSRTSSAIGMQVEPEENAIEEQAPVFFIDEGMIDASIVSLMNENLPHASEEQIRVMAFLQEQKSEIKAFSQEFEVFLLSQVERVQVAGPAIDISGNSDLILEAIKEKGVYHELYDQTQALLTLIHQGFQEVIDEYQFKVDVLSQNLLANKGLNKFEKGMVAAELASAALLKATFISMKATLPETPEGLFIDTAMLLSGAALLKTVGWLGKYVTKLDNLSGSKFGNEVTEAFENAIKKIEDLQTEVKLQALKAEKIVYLEGRAFTEHSLIRIGERGFSLEDAMHALDIGEKTLDPINGRLRHTLTVSNGTIRVITNEMDVIITVIRIGK